MTTKLNLSQDATLQFFFDGGSGIGHVYSSEWEERGASGLIVFSFLTSHELSERLRLTMKTDGKPFGIGIDRVDVSGDDYHVFCRVPCSFVDLTTLTTVE